MTKITHKTSMSCAAYLLLLHATIFVIQSSVVFASAQNQKGVRGSGPTKLWIDDLPHRHLAEDKNKNNKNNKNSKNKRDAGGVAKIETSTPPAENSDSFWSIVHPSQIEPETEPEPEAQPEPEPEATTSTLPEKSEPEATTSTSSKTPVLVPNENSEISETMMFDRTKFVAATKLQPITFNMNVKKFNAATNTTALKSYIKNFIEDVLDMKSNTEWYPLHTKSVDNLAIELFPGAVDDQNIFSPSGDQLIPVRLVINGVVFVHPKNQDTGASIARTRSAGASQQATITVDDSAFGSIFDHSMLLYFTFWGIEGLQKVLEEEGGLRKPVIGSVALGEKEVIAFGTDKDDNFAYKGDHDSSKAKRSQAKERSDTASSSTRTSSCGLLTLMLISASSLFL